MKRLKGLPVAQAIRAEVKEKVEAYHALGVRPTLATVRLGEDPDDIAYEESVVRVMGNLGIDVRQLLLPADATEETLLALIDALNDDHEVHGVLIFMPLPSHICEETVRHRLSPQKDMDGLTPENMARLLQDQPGMVPCTPRAVMELLDFYDIPLEGREVLVIGRSLVVGKPLSLMLLKRQATVTIAHSRTVDLPELSRRYDLVVVAVGRGHLVDETYVKEGATLIDVGINPSPDGGIIGDIDEQAVEVNAAALTPVPGGVGSVTTAVLAKQLLESLDGLYKK